MATIIEIGASVQWQLGNRGWGRVLISLLLRPLDTSKRRQRLKLKCAPTGQMRKASRSFPCATYSSFPHATAVGAMSLKGSFINSLPEVALQIRTVRSLDVVAMRSPPGSKVTQSTCLRWPPNTVTVCPVCRSHTRAVRSCDADATVCPLPETARWRIFPLCPTSVTVS